MLRNSPKYKTKSYRGEALLNAAFMWEGMEQYVLKPPLLEKYKIYLTKDF